MSHRARATGGAIPTPNHDAQPHLAASDLTLADRDQTLSDTDQTSSDSDQTSAESDQLASDRDQDASDRDLASGSSTREHGVSRAIRQRATRERGQSAQTRLDAAGQRDATAAARDLAAVARDGAADARDLSMARFDAASEQELGLHPVAGTEIVIRAARARAIAARYRAQAAEQRELAALDRERAAQDRDQAARERERALADRAALASQLAVIETDPQTGARALAAGLTDLDHELDRCRSTGAALVVAYVDVVALESLGDHEEHHAGGELLKRVVVAIVEQLRSFDLIVRIGDDAFLCAMSNVTLLDVRGRLNQVASAIAGGPHAGALRAGFAELSPGDGAAQLIQRAADELAEGWHGDHLRPPPAGNCA